MHTSSNQTQVTHVCRSKATDLLDIPIKELKSQPKFDGKRITVGVAVAANIGPDGCQKVLILQRAADEDAYPNMYELPGGNTEENDKTLRDTVIRELYEETGLKISHIVREFKGFEYTTKKGVAKQLNFLVSGPINPNVVLNPKEHQAWAWVGVDDSLDAFPMTEAMKTTVKHALEAMSV